MAEAGEAVVRSLLWLLMVSEVKRKNCWMLTFKKLFHSELLRS